MGGLNTSITGRAIDKGLISVEAVNIRDYSKDKHHHVDDAPYGGGAGMVMQRNRFTMHMKTWRRAPENVRA